jgi:hypothetical protein
MGTFWKDGYSAHVDIYLLVAGQQLPVAQVGPRELILQQPHELPPDSIGELVIDVDGRSVLYPIAIRKGARADSAIIQFEDLPSTPVAHEHTRSQHLRQRLLPLPG